MSNDMNFHPSTFLLLGTPEMEAIHTWLSVPFCLVYLGALMGNFVILFIIRADSSLHKPMLFFLCMLSVADLVISTTVVPQILSIFGSTAGRYILKPGLPCISVSHSFTMQHGIRFYLGHGL